MGLLDLPGLLISAIITGIFGIIGAVYCTAQTFQYVTGIVALGLFTFVYTHHKFFCCLKNTFKIS